MKRILLPLLVLVSLLSACASTDPTTLSRSSQINDANDLTRSGPQPDYSGRGSDSQMFTPPPGISSSSSTP
ncbi:MAG: hypothetical protein ABIZ04_01975 [Opitutus sp.]